MELPEKILQSLDSNKSKSEIDSLWLADQFGTDHQKIVGGIKSLESLGEIIKSESYVKRKWQLTDEGEYMVQNGSHEALLFSKVPVEGILQPDLMKAVGKNGKIGFSKAMSAFIRFEQI